MTEWSNKNHTSTIANLFWYLKESGPHQPREERNEWASLCMCVWVHLSNVWPHGSFSSIETTSLPHELHTSYGVIDYLSTRYNIFFNGGTITSDRKNIWDCPLKESNRICRFFRFPKLTIDQQHIFFNIFSWNSAWQYLVTWNLDWNLKSLLWI